MPTKIKQPTEAHESCADPDSSRSTGSDFEREWRYIVVKLTDARKHLTAAEFQTLDRLASKCGIGRLEDGKPALDCVVVESDWPEYEPTWAAIEARMTRKPARDFDHEEAHARAGYPDNR